MRSPEALHIIRDLLNKFHKKEDLKLLLKSIAGPNWPAECQPECQNTANQLAQWADNIELYPTLLEALATLTYGDAWNDTLGRIQSPVLKPHYREVALFMSRFADQTKIRQRLLTLINDIDWSFSYRLLNLLSPKTQKFRHPELAKSTDRPGKRDGL